MRDPKFYICNNRHIIIEEIENKGTSAVDSQDGFAELVANTSDGAVEKHLPVATVEGDKVVVNVGSVDHPMTEEHFISFVALYTDKGMQRKELCLTGKPHVEFPLLKGEKAIAVYAYCNLHGLWKTQL